MVFPLGLITEEIFLVFNFVVWNFMKCYSFSANWCSLLSLSSFNLVFLPAMWAVLLSNLTLELYCVYVCSGCYGQQHSPCCGVRQKQTQPCCAHGVREAENKVKPTQNASEKTAIGHCQQSSRCPDLGWAYAWEHWGERGWNRCRWRDQLEQCGVMKCCPWRLSLSHAVVQFTQHTKD